MAVLAPLLRAIGYEVHEHPDVDWVEVGMFSLMAMPSTAPPGADAGAIADLLLRTGRTAANFVTVGRGVPAAAWWVRDPGYGPHSLQRQFRQNLRRGAGRTEVRPLDPEELHRFGGRVHADATEARGGAASRPMTDGWWDRLCGAAASTPGVEAIGCFVDRALAGFVLAHTRGGLCEGLVASVSPRFTDARPAHALYHGFATEMIRRSGIRGVSLGRTSIPPVASLDAFKKHAGFLPEPVRVGVVLHPRRRWLAAPVVRAALHLSARMAGRRLRGLANVALLDAAAATAAEPEGAS